MTTGAAYQYRPLRYPDSVRILHLKPSLSGDDPIHCTLTTYRLSDPGLKYEPVSYTWGDASDVVDIYIGGNRAFLSVTRHCFNALTSLRLRDTPRHLWIDAICINQEDKVERSAQVQIMDQVYARGFRTLIYLGEATQGPGTDLLFDDLEKADREGFDRPVPGPEIVEQLERLIERPWFHRVWVVQEAFLNSERVVICGRRQASWDALESCLFGYLRSGNRVTQAPLPAVVYAAIEGWWSDIGCVWLNLFNSLNETRPLLASNPRDRIFALKALLGRDQDRLNPLIDYRRSVPDLLADVARQILDAVGLIILDAIQEPHKQPMASWIPDWTRVEHPIFNWTLGIRMYSDEVEEVPLKSPEREYHYKFSILPGTSPSFAVLKVHGWRLGPTLVMGKPFSFKDLDDVRRQLWPLLEHLHNLHQAGKPWQPLDEAFDPTGHFPPPIQRALFNMKGGLQKFLTHLLLGKMQFQDWITSGGGNGLLEDRECAEWAGRKLHGYRFCLVDDKHLAAVPHATLESDVVCLVLGNRHPCVLREKRNAGSIGSDERKWSVVGGNCKVWDPNELDDHDGGQFLFDEWFDDTVTHGKTEEWDELKVKLGEPEVFLLE